MLYSKAISFDLARLPHTLTVVWPVYPNLAGFDFLYYESKNGELGLVQISTQKNYYDHVIASLEQFFINKDFYFSLFKLPKQYNYLQKTVFVWIHGDKEFEDKMIKMK